MKKLTITISDVDDDGKETVYRKITTEGSLGDLAVTLVALGAEWERFLPNDSCEHCGDVHEDVPVIESSDEVREIQAMLGEILDTRYGPNSRERLAEILTTGRDEGAAEYMKLVHQGEAGIDISSMIEFVIARIRTSWLNEFTDFPENVLDQALAVTSRSMHQQLRIR